MHLTRRQFLALGAPAAAALVAACSFTPEQTTKKLRGRVQLLVGTPSGSAANQVAAQQDLVQAFVKAHPDIGIDFLRVPTPAAAAEQLRTLTSLGRPPDIVLPGSLNVISRLVDQGTWLDLRPFFDRDRLSLDTFLKPTTVEARGTSYYGTSSKHIVGVPVGVHAHVLAYNEGLFTKASVAPPPQSWSDDTWTYGGRFLDAAKALTTAGRFGIGRLSPSTVVAAFGGRRYDAANKKALFDSPETAAGIQFVADLVAKHHVLPTTGQVRDAQAAWRAGKLAMVELCSCELATPWGAGVPFAWRAAALPAGPSVRFNPLEVDLGAIVAASKQHELSWEVLKFFATDPINQAKFAYQGFGALPALENNGASFAPSPDPSVWSDAIDAASPVNDEWLPAFPTVNDLTGTTFDQIVAGAAAGPALTALQQQAQAAIDSWFQHNTLPR